jgi:6-phospho-3-hexuloisomerase
MIAISCSGKTATTTQFAKVSKQAGAKVAVMTTVPQSTLADMTDEIILFPSNLEDCPYAVGPNNNSMFEQAVMLYMDALVYVLLERKSIPKSIIVEQHTNLE